MIQRTSIFHVTVINNSDSPKLDSPQEIMNDMMDFLLDEYESAKIQLITTSIEVLDSEG